MRCPDCGGALRVYRTYHLSDTATRHYRKCQGCGARYASDEVLGARMTAESKSDAVDALTRWGVTPGKAEAIARKESASVIKGYSHNLAAIMLDYEAQNRKPVQDPAGFLAWVIETRYPLPGANGHGNGNGNGNGNGHKPGMTWQERGGEYQMDKDGKITGWGF